MRALGDLRSELGSPDRGPLGLDEYQRCAVRTYRGRAAGDEKLDFLLLGLFGEVGSLLSELKKKQRDPSSYRTFGSSSLEETGDVLWYLANIVDHCGLSLGDLAELSGSNKTTRYIENLQPQGSLFHAPATFLHVQASLLALAGSVGTLISRHRSSAGNETLSAGLRSILSQLVSASTDAQIGLAEAAHANLDKLLARWPIRRTWGPLSDSADLPTEQFPRLMQIRFEERRIDSRVYAFQSMNGVHLGDRLTDNRTEDDDYRFHDIFHLAFAGILGWSPVLRSILNVRRRSQPEIDEAQDGARAKITEEGLSNWIFAHGLRHEALEHVDGLDFTLLKTIGEMVRGYEAETLLPWMWEHAILEGFRIFRFLREHRGGLVTADLNGRCLKVERLSSQ